VEAREHDDFCWSRGSGFLIEITRSAMDAGRRQPLAPGEKLKLLFAGYNGTRNTGSDVRVNEMLRQIAMCWARTMSISA